MIRSRQLNKHYVHENVYIQLTSESQLFTMSAPNKLYSRVKLRPAYSDTGSPSIAVGKILIQRDESRPDVWEIFWDFVQKTVAFGVERFSDCLESPNGVCDPFLTQLGTLWPSKDSKVVSDIFNPIFQTSEADHASPFYFIRRFSLLFKPELC